MDAFITGSNLLLIVAGFCLLIGVHELGHFLAARWAGIRVHEFAIGMGPTVLSYRRGVGFRRGSTDRVTADRFGAPAVHLSDRELDRHGIGETEYALRALPLGGFVRMLGQEDCNPQAVSDDPRSYQRAPIWKRMIVVSAGVIANLILAIVLFVVAFMVGVRFEAPVAGAIPPNSPAAQAVALNADTVGLSASEATGIRPGDRVVSIDGEPISTSMDILLAGGLSQPDVAVEIVVERPGVPEPLRFEVIPTVNESLGLLWFGIMPAHSTKVTNEREDRDLVSNWLDGSGLGAQGVGPGDRLVSANGVPIATASELVRALDASDGHSLDTVWAHPDGSTFDARLTPAPDFSVYVGADQRALDASERSWDWSIGGLLPLVRVDAIRRGTPNADTLRRGDVFLRLADVPGPSFSAFRRELQRHAGGDVDAIVQRDGSEVCVTCRVSSKGLLEFLPSPAYDVPMIAGVMPERLAERQSDAGDASNELEAVPTAAAGVKDAFPLSTIRSVDGVPVRDWADIRRELRRAAAGAGGSGDPAPVAVVAVPPFDSAAPETLEMRFSRSDLSSLQALGWSSDVVLTFDPEFTTLKATGPLDAIAMGLAQTKRMVLHVYLTIDRLLLKRTIGIEQLNGPVGIVHAGVKVADRGFMYLLFFLAAISVNLAVMNFLPLPIVDGGLFLFLVYERIRGRPPSIAFQNAATAVGLMLIASIFLITFFNDIRRLIG